MHIQMTTMCLAYLSLPHVDPCLPLEDIRKYILEGRYAFSDYAIAHWLDHMEETIAVLRTRVEEDTMLELKALAGEILPFLQLQFSKPAETNLPTSFNKRFDSFDPFQSYGFVKHLGQAAYDWSCRLSHRDKDREEIANSVPAGLESILLLLRAGLDQLAQSGRDLNELQKLHGRNLFKCSSVYCRFFYEGFQSNKEKISHQNKHNNTYTCTFHGCPNSVLGFSSARSLEAHICAVHDGMDWKHTEQPGFPIIEDPESIDIAAAAKKGDLARAQRWAEQFQGEIPFESLNLIRNMGYSVAESINGQSPLMIAMKQGNYDIAELFLTNIDPKENIVLKMLYWTSITDAKKRHFDLLLSLPFKVENIDMLFSVMRRGVISRDVSLSLQVLKSQASELKKLGSPSLSRLFNLMAKQGFLSCVEFLLEEADFNLNCAEAKSKRTALMEASEFGQTHIVSALISNKRFQASTADYSYKGASAGFLAACNGNIPVLKLLTAYIPNDIERLLNIADLRQACIDAEELKVQKLLKVEGLNADVPDRHFYTPFLHAIERGHVGIVKMFLVENDNHININQKCLAHHDSIDSAKLDLKKWGATGLILATVNGHKEIVNLILQDKNVNTTAECYFRAPSQRTSKNCSAEAIARLLNFTEIERSLKEYEQSRIT